MALSATFTMLPSINAMLDPSTVAATVQRCAAVQGGAGALVT